MRDWILAAVAAIVVLTIGLSIEAFAQCRNGQCPGQRPAGFYHVDRDPVFTIAPMPVVKHAPAPSIKPAPTVEHKTVACEGRRAPIRRSVAALGRTGREVVRLAIRPVRSLLRLFRGR
jgi:hypothetical protein